MLPSRGYQPSYPPPRNFYGQNQSQAQTQSQSHQSQPQNIYSQGPQHVLQQQPQQSQHENVQQPNGAPPAAAAGDGSAVPGGEMNLASVLHYLQSEWRRWERDRNEWEIERAEMRARIALLEGQRRSAENLKVDLLRRVKMLEFALRQERTKSVNTVGKASGIAPSKLATLQEDDRTSNNEKEGSSDSGGSGGGEDRDEATGERKPNGNHASSSKLSTMSKSSSASDSASNFNSNTWKSVGAVPRDPKSRARSREYLKQCLQEITYLTSPGALNPLPPRPLLADIDLPEQKPGMAEREPERPTKALPSRAIPPLFERPKEEPVSGLPNGVKQESPEPLAGNKPSSPLATEAPVITNKSQSHLAVETSAQPPSSPSVHTRDLPELEGDAQEAGVDEDAAYPEQSKQLLTAIYRPESKTEWREKLRSANETAERRRDERSRDAGSEGQLSHIALNSEDEEVKGDEAGPSKTWAQKFALRGHLDVVRSVAIAGGQEVTLVTGGDDNTVKVWTDLHALASKSQRNAPASETEATMTFRGHTMAITSVIVSSPLQLVFSASLDSTIRLWRLPSATQDPYGSYDPSFAVQTLVGHTDAIWDLCLLPTQTSAPFARKNSVAAPSRLASASADGTVKIWTNEGGKEWTLVSSVGEFGLGVVPTCLGVYHPDYTKLLVGLSDGSIQLYSVDNQVKEILFKPEGASPSQVNAVISHPTLPLVVGGYEDGHIQTFDTSAASSSTISAKDRFFAHPSPVTTLTLSPASHTCIISASTDCTIRVWDLNKNVSVQDIESHRQKGGEGICAVAGHPDLPLLASAGADGVVRVWSA